MSEVAFSNMKMAYKHIPDFSMEYNSDGQKVRVPLPGKIQFGFEVDGVFVPVAERKAPGLLADIERSKEKKTGPSAEAVQD